MNATTVAVVAPASAGEPRSSYEAAGIELEIADRVIRARDEGVAAVVTWAMRDVGMTAAREVVDIPVVGPGLASMRVAAMLGRRFSVLVSSPGDIQAAENQVARYGLRDRFASARAIQGGARNGDDRSEVLAEALTEAVAAIEHDRAHVLILGCPSMRGLAGRLRDRLAAAGYPGVPVVEPLPVAKRLAGIFAELGLIHSRRTYPSADEFIRQARGLPLAD